MIDAVERARWEADFGAIGAAMLTALAAAPEAKAYRAGGISRHDAFLTAFRRVITVPRFRPPPKRNPAPPAPPDVPSVVLRWARRALARRVADDPDADCLGHYVDTITMRLGLRRGHAAFASAEMVLARAGLTCEFGRPAREKDWRWYVRDGRGRIVGVCDRIDAWLGWVMGTIKPVDRSASWD